MKVKQEKSTIWLYLKLPISKTILMENSRGDLYINMVVDWFFPCFILFPKRGVAYYLKQEFSFYRVYKTGFIFSEDYSTCIIISFVTENRRTELV